MFRIKICGITTPEDAQLAVDAGAEAIGINFYAGSPRYVGLAAAKKIAAASQYVAVVGVFVNESTAKIKQLMAEIPLDFVQLHGDETPEMLAQFDPQRVMKAFRCRDDGLQPVADFLVACSLNPAAVLIDAYAHGRYGGTGASLDWSAIGKDARLPADVPMFLAGGLTAENVAQAIRLARPFGVDVASGVEASVGVKDAAKVSAFVANAKSALGRS